MSWYLDGINTWLFNSGDSITRGGNQAANMAAGSQNRTLNPFDSGMMVVGEIIRVGAGTYDVSVETPIHPHVTCILGEDVGAFYFGTSDCYLPVEGSKVLVYIPIKNVCTGIILRVLPAMVTGTVLDRSKKAPYALIHLWDIEPGATAVSEARYALAAADPDNPNVRTSNNGKPVDLMPGNRAWLNEQGVGLAVLNLIASLKASDRARIDVCCLDDIVRIISGFYRHINAQGEDQIYNDGGRLTREINLTSHQCEKSGFMDYGSSRAPFVKSDTKAFLKDGMTSKYELIGDDVAAKNRFQLFVGHLGDIVNLFVAQPYAAEPNYRTSTNPDPGLMHTHIDSSGRMQIRTAAGISLERCDRIPVPRRKVDPWDPAGDKMENVSTDSAKTPFTWSTQYPYARSLEMRDAMAWRNKQALQRINDQSQSEPVKRKDFYLPEEQDLETPPDEYDNVGQGTENYSANANRRAYFNLEEDGSIVMRDAWGSEIILRGGNIILNCAGQIEVRSGRDIVQLAGYDIISKAKNSVDITATDQDVRVKAGVNLQMVSEGGVIVESLAPTDSNGYTGRTGERVNSTGVILKAVHSHVVADGRVVQLSSPNLIKVDGKDVSGKATGNFEMGVKTAVFSTDRYLSLVSGKNSGLIITRNVGVLAARSVAVIGARSLQNIAKGELMLPAAMQPLTQDPYPTMQQRFQDTEERYIESNQWLDPYSPTARLEVQFTYRSSAEYGTLSGSEIYGASKFYVYQATWALMAGQNHPLVPVVVAKWSETAIAGLYPWPGEAVYGSSDSANCYVMLTNETNIGDLQKEVPKPRGELKSNAGTLEAKPFNEYEVVAAKIAAQ